MKIGCFTKTSSLNAQRSSVPNSTNMQQSMKVSKISRRKVIPLLELCQSIYFFSVQEKLLPVWLESFHPFAIFTIYFNKMMHMLFNKVNI